jgi:hypothetical protein
MGGSIEETYTTSSLGEFSVAILLTLLAKKMPRGTWTTDVRTEVAGGVGIFVCLVIAYGITGLLPVSTTPS